MNELLEKYIKDNHLDIFDKKYINDLTIQLNDKQSEMTLTQCFNYVLVEIDGEFFHTYEYSQGIDKKLHWFVIK